MLIVFVAVVAIAAVGGYIAGFVMGRDLKMHEAYRLYKKCMEMTRMIKWILIATAVIAFVIWVEITA